MRASRFLVSLLLLVCGSAAAAESNVLRRFASPEAQGEEDASTLCHHIHLLPVGSTLHARALEACQALRPSLSKKVIDEPGSPTLAKKNFKDVFDEQKLKNIEAQKARVRTPTENAGLAALDAKQTKVQDLQTKTDAQTAAFKNEAAAAEQQAAKDAADRAAQWKVQLDDQLKQAKYQSDIDAGVQAKVDDALDVKRVENAKANWVELEDSITTAKAKAAKDAEVVAAYDTKLKTATEQRQKAEAERLADQAEAQRDKDLADSADKAAREQARIERQKLRDAQAQELEKSLTAAAAERKAAVERQQVLLEEEAKRLKLQKQIDDMEVALVANRKNREVEQLEREKRLTAFKKVEEDIKLRRAAFQAAEDARLARAKAHEEAELQRLKAQAQVDADLAKAKEDEGPPEGRKKQDDEEECTDKTVNCNGGKCLQLKNDPKVKRCQCDGDAGSNCQFPPCEYDIDDGTGKSKKQKGHTVNGQCVRWKAEYRCQCDKAWRLDVKCMKKQGVREIQVPDRECLGVREPENRYRNQVCELCRSKCSLRGRGLTSADEAMTNAATNATTRRLAAQVADCNTVHLECDTDANPIESPLNRMAYTIENYKRPEMLPDKGIPPSHARGKYTVEIVADFKACRKICLERDGTESGNPKQQKMEAITHCSWVYYEETPPSGPHHCFVFYTGMLPLKATAATATTASSGDASTAQTTGTAAPTGFLAFVTYPRRWDLTRKFSKPVRPTSPTFCTHATPLRKFTVFEGRNNADTEGEGTFAIESVTLGGDDCVSTRDSQLENAQGYFRKLPSTYQEMAVTIPREWQRYLDQGQRDTQTLASKVSKPSISWSYTVDDRLRPVRATGSTWRTPNNDRGDSGFENTFNWVHSLPLHTDENAPFCAGHVIAYELEPVNFYFNYVPQHQNSNSGRCWRGAERAANSLLEMGCKLKYTVEVDYGRNGEELPSDIKKSLPDWAHKADDTKNPKPGKVPVGDEILDSYLNDELKCHYRFRPISMSLDMTIEDHKIGNGLYCKYLHAALSTSSTPLIRASGTEVISTRLYAVILNKEKPDKSYASVPHLERFLYVATAMKKPEGLGEELRCYAETGNIAAFSKVRLLPHFFKAFIGDVAHKKCLRLDRTDRDCPKWSLQREGDYWGWLLSEAGMECLVLDSTTNTVEAELITLGDLSACGQFKYLDERSTFEVSDLKSLVNEAGKKMKADDLNLGYVMFPGVGCLTATYTLSTNPDDCWVLRVSHYLITKQPPPKTKKPKTSKPATLRLLQDGDAEDEGEVEDEDEDGDGSGGDDDDGGDGVCLVPDPCNC